MNETIQVLMNRKSVRVFENKEISPEIKDIILAAAMRAPTGGNCMPYSIIDVTDQSIKDKLAETCDHQPFIALSTKRLQKAGYLTKEVDAENLRCKRLYISEEGQRVCAMCRERLDQIDAVAFQGFSEEELEAFSSFLDRVTLNMTGETENVVSGELFGHLCRELDAIEKEAKKS